MSGPTDMPIPSDEQLVAYLDGALPIAERGEVNRMLAASPEALDRLEHLRAGGRPFAEALDTLLDQAPVERMMARLDATPAPMAGPAALPTSEPANDVGPRGWMPMAAAAAVLVALVGGFFGGQLSPTLQISPQAMLEPDEPVEVEVETVAAPAPPERGWRQAVADYQVLFTADSLTPYQGGDSGLPLANAALGIPLDTVAADAERLNFRRVQVLDFNDKVLVQLAYLSIEGKPVSFCIIASGKPEAPLQFEERNGLGIAHWILAGYGFMVIGDLPQTELQAVADTLKQRIGI